MTDELPRLVVYVCPYCGRQGRAPGAHHVAGDDLISCRHAHPGERGVFQPRMVKIEVVPAEPFVPREIPHDAWLTPAIKETNQ